MRTLTICAVAFSALLGFGCGGDDDGPGPGGTGGSGGTGGTTEMCTGEATDDINCINPLCPQQSPVSGARAMKGTCCFRKSNADAAKAAWDAGELATLEFRQNALQTYSQPTTVGLSAIQGALLNTYSRDWSNTLVRIEGVPATGSGPVTVTVGSGRYNCDGTYSFFGDEAAANTTSEGRTDGARWEASVMEGMWDWDSEDKLILPVANRAPGVRWAPVAKSDGMYGYEQPAQDLYYSIAFEGDGPDDLDPNSLNCLGGELLRRNMWRAELEQITFFPVADVMAARIDSAAVTQNFCSFLGIGYNASEMCDDVDQADWMEKPRGMCDEDHCYVGAAGSATENSPADCGTADKPCCDPSGVSTDLPACNAFVILARAVLAGADITDEPHNDPAEIFMACNE